LELTLKAEKPGLIDNVLVARADANLFAESRVQIEVIAPQLKIDMKGPSRRYLEREATFTIPVANPGTAPAKEVELTVHLPRGVNFVNTNNAGYYDQQGHAVHWSLAELPPGEAGDVQLTVLPTDIGEHKLRVEAKADMGLVDAIEKTLAVEGLVALYFGLADVTDPIEVGGQTTYEIRVVNQGSKIATNLQLVATVPPGMKAIGGDGPTRVALEDQRVVFEPLARLAPQDDAVFQVHVKGVKAGDQRFRAQLVSDAMTQPVTKEESTRVYADD
jgi:uncharacterized repeat protein (TIGR01451 family)